MPWCFAFDEMEDFELASMAWSDIEAAGPALLVRDGRKQPEQESSLVAGGVHGVEVSFLCRCWREWDQLPCLLSVDLP